MHPVCLASKLRIEWQVGHPDLPIIWEDVFDFAQYVSELMDQFGPNALIRILYEEFDAATDTWSAVNQLAEKGQLEEAMKLRDQIRSRNGAGVRVGVVKQEFILQVIRQLRTQIR